MFPRRLRNYRGVFFVFSFRGVFIFSVFATFLLFVPSRITKLSRRYFVCSLDDYDLLNIHTLNIADRGPELVKELGSRALFVEIDATDEKSVKEGIQKTVNHFGGLHGAINCAGIGSAALTVDKRGRTHNSGIWDFVMKLNAYGVFYASAHAAAAIAKGEPDEDKQRGVIINVSSVAGLEGQKGQLAYSASKGAVIGMTLPMARDLSRFGIRVMTICPGIVDTPLMAMANEKVRQGLLRQV